MRRTTIFVLASACSYGLVPSAEVSAGLRAFIEGIGDLPGGATESHISALSPDGSVIVGRSASASGDDEAFYWTEATGMQGVGDLPGGVFFSRARDVAGNENGFTMIGISEGATGQAMFRYSPSTGIVAFDDGWEDGNGLFSVSQISDDERFVSGTVLINDDLFAMRWSEETGPVHFTATDAQGAGISADGSMVVGTGIIDTHGFRWEVGVGSVTVGFIQSGCFPESRPAFMTPDGSVVIGRYLPGCGSSRIVFRWDEANGTQLKSGFTTDRGPTSGVFASAVSNTGHLIYGTSDSSRVPSGSEAAIWVGESTPAERLSEYLADEYGFDLQGWQITSVADVSQTGRTIVGNGINPEGDTEGFVIRIGVFDAECPGDCSGNERVEFNDLVCTLFRFGNTDVGSEHDCNGDGVVDFSDLVCILFRFGPCPFQ